MAIDNKLPSSPKVAIELKNVDKSFEVSNTSKKTTRHFS
jgi:hypothetical protein